MTNSINLRFPLRRSPRGAFQTNDQTIDAVADNLKILLLTNYGERPIHYDFGANLRSILFEQGDYMHQQIVDAITAAVDKWMPYVNIVDIQVTDSSTDTSLVSNQVLVKMKFTVGQIEGEISQQLSV